MIFKRVEIRKILKNEIIDIIMSMEEIKKQIEEIVNRETKAWNTQDVELLMTIFHPDMVWPWPRTSKSHDPMDWVLEIGKFDYKRWKRGWQELFDNYTLVHNEREIKKIEISKERDGAFAVVDIDTLWKDSNNNENHWKGRVCKVYTKLKDGWKLIMHTGVLEY
ncbi:MAG: YybH family protein [Promethearchaeota archaeon]